MCSKHKLAVLTIAAVSLASGSLAQENVTVVASGMLAFVESENSLQMLLPNMVDEMGSAMHGVVHWPLLQVRCLDIVDTDLQSACKAWRPNTEDGYGSIPLQAGYDIEIDFGNKKEALKVESSFREGVRSLPSLVCSECKASTAKAILLDSPKNNERLRRLVVARWVVDGGRISAELRPEITWRFGAPSKNPTATKLLNAKSISVHRTVESGATVVRLTPFNGGEPYVLKLHPWDEAVGIVMYISNDPHPFDYCQHAPTPAEPEATHFLRFYDLTRVSSWKIPSLPRPSLESGKEDCEALWGGKRVNCDAVLLAP